MYSTPPTDSTVGATVGWGYWANFWAGGTQGEYKWRHHGDLLISFQNPII